MKKISVHRKNQHGLSLIELLISMLLGSIVMIAAAQIVISIISSKKLLHAESELQESARFGLSVISAMIQGSGSFGCKTPEEANIQSIVNTSDPSFRPWKAIEGWEADESGRGDVFTTSHNATILNVANGPWTSSDGAVMNTGISSIKHSDLLKVWFMKGERGSLKSYASGVLSFSEMALKVGDIIVINDCNSLTFAQACSCENPTSNGCTGADISSGSSCSSPGNKPFTFNNINYSTAEIGVLQQAIFFVNNSNDTTNGIPTLYMAGLGKDGKYETPEEVLSYVENLQVLYGEDTTGDSSPNKYVSANVISDWRKVVSIKISLLLRSSENNLLPESQKLFFNNAPVNIADGDRHLRRVYSSTVSLRNRGVGF